MHKKAAVLLWGLAGCVLANPTENTHSPTLTMGIDESPPYSYKNERGKAAGKIVELMETLALQSNIKLEYVFCPWARCINLIQSGQIDLLAGLAKSKGREASLHFIEPPIFEQNATFGFYIHNTNISISSYADLSGLVIGKLRGSQHFTQFDQDDTLTTVDAPDIETLFRLLKTGRIDAFIHLNETIDPYFKEFDSGYNIQLAEYSYEVNSRGYLVLSKLSGNTRYAKTLGEAVSKLSESGLLSPLME